MMTKYGQFCPVARSLEILGDRWTLLIVREMLLGMRHFNDLERGLPGISRPLLAQRLRQLQKAGVVEKRVNGGQKSTEYVLTQAGRELEGVITALLIWGEAWAFDEPAPAELDPVLLMWRLRNDVRPDRLPARRIVVQFDLRVPQMGDFWLILTTDDVTLCVTDPGYATDVLVTADLAALYKLYWGRIRYDEAIANYGVRVEGMPQLVEAFPHWFAWQAATGTAAANRARTARLAAAAAAGEE